MGRPPSNGGPSFRFNSVEVGEMEAILQAHHYAVPAREILEALAQRFSATAERAGKVEVSGKQVWNWFQNRRYALRARAAKAPAPVHANTHALPMPIPRDDQATVRNGPQAPQPQTAPPSVKSVPQAPHPLPAPSAAAQSVGRNTSDTSQMEFEAKSARDGAWYDVTLFLSHRSLETGDPEALVRFAGFGPEEDEWVNIRRHVRQRSLPCESSECVAVLPGDLILCFQEGKEQALYFDAHVLDAQRRRHDVRGCRCRFLVRYDHDQSEEIVPLRKICRRPETDFRLQQLQAESTTLIPQKQKPVADSQALNTLKANTTSQAPQMQPKTEQHTDSVPHANVPPRVESGVPTTVPPRVESGVMTTVPQAATTTVPQANVPPRVESGATITVPLPSVPPRIESGATTTVPQANFPPRVESGAKTTVRQASVPPHIESGATTTVPQANIAPRIESVAAVTVPQDNVAPRIESGATTTVLQASVPPRVESVATVTVPQANVPPRIESGSMTTVPLANVPPRVETGPTTTLPQANMATIPQSCADSGAIPTTVPAASESKLPEAQANPETAELKS